MVAGEEETGLPQVPTDTQRPHNVLRGHQEGEEAEDGEGEVRVLPLQTDQESLFLKQWTKPGVYNKYITRILECTREY